MADRTNTDMLILEFLSVTKQTTWSERTTRRTYEIRCCKAISTGSTPLKLRKVLTAFLGFHLPYLHNLIYNLTTKFFFNKNYTSLRKLQFTSEVTSCRDVRSANFIKFIKLGDLHRSHRSRFKLGFSKTSSKIRCATQITWTWNWTSSLNPFSSS